MEMRSRSNVALWKQAYKVADGIKFNPAKRDWLILQVNAMNPKKLSVADIESLKLIIESHGGF